MKWNETMIAKNLNHSIPKKNDDIISQKGTIIV